MKIDKLKSKHGFHKFSTDYETKFSEELDTFIRILHKTKILRAADIDSNANFQDYVKWIISLSETDKELLFMDAANSRIIILCEYLIKFM